MHPNHTTGPGFGFSTGFLFLLFVVSLLSLALVQLPLSLMKSNCFRALISKQFTCFVLSGLLPASSISLSHGADLVVLTLALTGFILVAFDEGADKGSPFLAMFRPSFYALASCCLLWCAACSARFMHQLQWYLCNLLMSPFPSVVWLCLGHFTWPCPGHQGTRETNAC